MIKLLIVDDETIACSTIRCIIESNFPQIGMISEAYNGKAALEKAQELEPDIVIMDIEMPMINGIEASRRIKNLLPKCAIIFLTAFASFTYAKQAITLGAVEYLLKPVEPEELVAIMKQTLRQIKSDSLMDGILPPKNEEKKKLYADKELQKVQGIGERSLMVVHEVKAYIDAHYMDDISVESLADQFQISVSHFNRIFKQSFQVNCKEYITSVRVEKAKEYLTGSVLNVSEIGSMVGYPDANYFTKVFRKKTGMTPKEYRNEQFFLPDD